MKLFRAVTVLILFCASLSMGVAAQEVTAYECDGCSVAQMKQRAQTLDGVRRAYIYNFKGAIIFLISTNPQ